MAWWMLGRVGEEVGLVGVVRGAVRYMAVGSRWLLVMRMRMRMGVLMAATEGQAGVRW